MSRVCQLTDKSAQFGNNVSHALNRTRRRFNVNLRAVTLRSDALNRDFPLTIAAHTLRSVDHNGGLDNYLVTAKANNLSQYGQKLRRQIKKAQASQ